MISKTQGIVLKKTPYGDNSAVINIYTQDYGKLGFMVRGLNSKKNTNSYFMPGNILAIVMYNNEKKQLKTIKEVSAVLHSAPQNPLYSIISQIMIETIDKTTSEQEADSYMFDICWQFLINIHRNYNTYYLHQFYIEFIENTGNSICSLNHEPQTLTAAYEGMIMPNKIIQFTMQDIQKINDIKANRNPKLDRQQRNALLKKIVGFIELHLSHGKTINSIKIAEQIL